MKLDLTNMRRPEAILYASVILLPTVVTGAMALLIGGSWGEAAMASGMVASAGTAACATVWGQRSNTGGRQVGMAVCAGLGMFILLGCYAYGRLSGMPTDELRLGLGTILLAMAIAGLTTIAMNRPRPSRCE